ncbi:MAG: hypothetical protein U0325_06995 [Polyangiales bacterium]
MHLTGTGTVLGTPAYMAPEQAQGAKHVTAAADQYAVGAILFHALSRALPHHADSYAAMLVAIVSQPPRDLRELRPDLDPPLCAVVMRALARDPAARYPTLDALRDALRPFVALDAPAPAQTRNAERANTNTAQNTTPSRPSVPTQQPALILSGGPPRPVAPMSIPGNTPPPAPPRSSSGLAGAAVVVALAAVTMLALAVGLTLRAPTAPRPVAAPARPDVPAPSAPREFVTFSIDVTPATATILLDGEPIGNGHAEVLRPRDGVRHQLMLRAPGHAVMTDVLVASADARVSRVLSAVDVPRPPRPPAAPQPAPQPAPPPAPQPAPPDLRHPHIDRRLPF